MHESAIGETMAIEKMMNDLLASKKIVGSKRVYQTFDHFRFQDVLEFDHIISINSPGFHQYLEDNIHRIAKWKAVEGMEKKQAARLTTYDLPSSIQVPELMSSKGSAVPEMFQNRQKLALDEIFRAIQRFTLDFLEREYGLKKTNQGFVKVPSRSASRSSSLPPLDRRVSPMSSGD